MTALATGTHWWQVSMANTLVYQVKLEAFGHRAKEITVSLYSGETLAGQCQSHTGSKGYETLSCVRVAADRVKLSIADNGELTQVLLVWEIKVTQAPKLTIGLYQPEF